MNLSHPSQHRKCSWNLILGLLLGIAGPALAASQPTNSPLRLDYTAFKVIPERNIFNPRRTGSSGFTPADARREVAVERVALVGIMTYEKGPFAFFDSNSLEYRKVLRPEETIAGYKITEISGQSVKLEAGTNTVELGVGMQLRREDKGPWQAVAVTESIASVPDQPSNDRSRGERSRDDRPGGERSRGDRSRNDRFREGAPAALSAGPAASGGEASDALKRLMEKRAQETK